MGYIFYKDYETNTNKYLNTKEISGYGCVKGLNCIFKTNGKVAFTTTDMESLEYMELNPYTLIEVAFLTVFSPDLGVYGY